MNYTVTLGGHTIAFEDGTFECKDCEISESVPHIFYKDGAESVQKYKYYALGLIQRQPCTGQDIEDIIEDLDGGVTDIGDAGIAIGDVTTTNGGPSITDRTTISGNSVVDVNGDKIHLQDGMPATYEDQQKLQKHIEIQQKQQEIRNKMGL